MRRFIRVSLTSLIVLGVERHRLRIFVEMVCFFSKDTICLVSPRKENL